MRLALITVSLVGSAGCGFKSLDFACTNDSACIQSGVQGVCEPIGYCAFPDSSCQEGQRYSDHSGDYTGLCVGTLPPGVDGGSDGSIPTDCWPAWKAGTIAFSPPVRIPELVNAAQQAHPSLSGDDLTMYFDREVPARARDFYVTTRSAPGMPWATPTALGEINTTLDEERFSVTADGTYAVFASTRGGGTAALFTATRASGTGLFSTPTQTDVVSVNTSPTEFDPQVSRDGLRLYHSPVRADGSQFIALASRATTTVAFGAPVAISELSITTSVSDPTPSPDELVIVFSSPNGASHSLYYATRANVGSPFGMAKLVPNVNAGPSDANTALSSSGCELFFTSTRGGPKQLYVAVAR